MRLEKVIMDGFRGYSERTEIPIGQMTAFIGENDIGKSTVLEALDAFFNGVADPQDVNTRSGERRFTIGCIFSALPDQINLDVQSATTLQDEFLVNAEGKLEIYTVWRATATKAEVERVYARANAPSAEEARDLLFRKRDELKAIVDKKNLDADRRRNPAMRQAIYRNLEEEGRLDLREREVELDRPKEKEGHFEDARKIGRS